VRLDHLHTMKAAALIAAGLLSLAMHGHVHAQDDDRALTTFARPAAAAPRTEPVLPAQWDRALAPADRLGPKPLRSADAALLAATRDARWADALQLLKTGQASANVGPLPSGQPSAHALVLAARAGQDELVRALIQRGADINRLSDDGFHALGAAAMAGQRSTVRLLMLAGAEPEHFSATGQTALHLASLAGQIGVIEELLRLRVNIEMLNRQRESALDVAAGADQQDVMARLLAAGADPLSAGRR
jgi:Ankyrin repeats (3 copies)/Ankyrin repeat